LIVGEQHSELHDRPPDDLGRARDPATSYESHRNTVPRPGSKARTRILLDGFDQLSASNRAGLQPDRRGEQPLERVLEGDRVARLADRPQRPGLRDQARQLLLGVARVEDEAGARAPAARLELGRRRPRAP
jgi:hypothetical protein